MPGRQSTGPAPRQKARRQPKKRKRALDAFAIAEEEFGAVKTRPSRLGQIEGPRHTGYAQSSDQDENDDENQPRRVKRPRNGDRDANGVEIDGGSDSEGNEWVTGRVRSDDDSSLDSDEALGDSDEEEFARFAFQGSLSKRTTKSERPTVELRDEIDLNEDEEASASSDTESEGFAADAMDLADVLNQRDSESENEGVSKPGNRTQQQLVGQPLSRVDDDADSVSQLSFSEEEHEEGDADGFSGLQKFVTSLDEGKDRGCGIKPADAHESVAPSDFGITSKKKLSVTDMIDTVSDPKARKALRSLATDSKATGLGSGIPQKLAVPLAKRQQDRIDRSMAYDKSKETLERWVETVKHNRRAEHLEFPLPDPAAAAAKSNAHLSTDTSVKPLTALESTIQKILEDSGMDPQNGKSQDAQIQAFEELAANDMPIEDVRARRAQLRQTRELLFREERKAKRIKKIKSKSWRRVHRKERERDAERESAMLTEAGVQPDDDEIERLHRQRAEERMGGRHRSSRWAKRVKGIGRSKWDEEARAGIHEMARREEELKRRIEGKDADVSASEFGSESDDESFDEDESPDSRRLLKKLDDLQRPSDAPSGLHSLKFMQKAEAARKAQNDEDVERLRRELAGEATPDASDADELVGRRAFGPKAKSTAAASELRGEFEERDEPDDNELDGGIGDHEVDIVTEGKGLGKPPRGAPRETSQLSRKSSVRSHDKAATQPAMEDNPWLTIAKKSRKHAVSTSDVHISTTTALPSQAEAPIPAHRSKLQPKPTATPATTLAAPYSDTSSSADANADANETPNNAALIRQAFAADDVLAATDFAAEQAALAAEEAAAAAPPEEERMPGWGSWVGDGVATSSSRSKAADRPSTSATSLATTAPSHKTGDKVILSSKRIKANVPYLASQLPHPFETRAQYERALRLPVGPEWVTRSTHVAQTAPRVKVRKGEVVRAMRRPVV